MSLLMDIQTNRCWARVDFLATGEIVLHIPEECELPIRVLVSRGGRSTEYEPNSSENPNNSTISKMEQVDKDINVRSKDEPTMRLHEWTSDDITFCTAKCEVKCFRKPKYIKHKDIPHSFSDFSNSCVEYEPKDEPQYDFGEYADRLWKIAYERGKREALEQTEPSCDTCKLKDTTEWCKRQEVCRAYKPKDAPQTCDTCKHKGEYAYCRLCGSLSENNYEPKDEPQSGKE